MPTSIDPQPSEDEIECGNCGAYFYYELTRCPKCGVSVYGPENETEADDPRSSKPGRNPSNRITDRLDRFIRRLLKKPYPVDELFGAPIYQAELYDDLLTKVGGDRLALERLIDLERQQYPQGNRTIWLRNAIQHWERDNRSTKSL